MNHYTQILKYIKELAESDPLVNKVTQGEASKAMFDKITLFPLVHISVGGFSFGEDARTVIWDVIIGAMKQRQNTNEQTTDNYYLNTNEVDNFNETSAIINRLVSRINADLSKSKINVSVIGNAEKQDEEYGADKDGYVINLSLEIPNNEVNLCQYPIT
tara:strand:- start:655 stop:1131 length:477 start_codon:yes stop_codon:yes gene_type:complete